MKRGSSSTSGRTRPPRPARPQTDSLRSSPDAHAHLGRPRLNAETAPNSRRKCEIRAVVVDDEPGVRPRGLRRNRSRRVYAHAHRDDLGFIEGHLVLLGKYVRRVRPETPAPTTAIAEASQIVRSNLAPPSRQGGRRSDPNRRRRRSPLPQRAGGHRARPIASAGVARHVGAVCSAAPRRHGGSRHDKVARPDRPPEVPRRWRCRSVGVTSRPSERRIAATPTCTRRRRR